MSVNLIVIAGAIIAGAFLLWLAAYLFTLGMGGIMVAADKLRRFITRKP